MRRDVQEIFRNTPHEKQVMMFSATLSKEIRAVCKRFMQDVISTPFLLAMAAWSVIFSGVVDGQYFVFDIVFSVSFKWSLCNLLL